MGRSWAGPHGCAWRLRRGSGKGGMEEGEGKGGVQRNGHLSMNSSQSTDS
jgi:hypothetical protein